MQSRRAILTAALIVSVCSFTQGQETRQFVEKPLWIMWHTGFSEQSALAYVQRIAEETGISEDLDDRIKKEFKRERSEQRPIKGTAMFLVRGLIPSVDTIEFRELRDEAEFMEVVKQRQREFSVGNSEQKAPAITGSGNLKSVVITRRYESPMYEMKTIKNADGTEQANYVAVKDEDGKPVMQVNEWTQKSYFRLEKGILYEASFEELHDMELPSAETFGIGRRKRMDAFYFRADLKMVPKGIKSVAWNLVSSQANMLMQQRDEENRIPYEFRKSVSDISVELLRSAFFDIEEATGSIKFATDTKPVRASLDLKVRSNSKMAKHLRELGKGRAKLPVDEQAVMSLRSTWAMPQAFRSMLTTAAPLLRKIADEEVNDDAAQNGLNGIADALEGSGANGSVFETTMNLGGTAESGPVLYGAIRADQGDKLSSGLQALLQLALRQANEPNLPSVEAMEGNDRQYVKIAFPDAPWPSELKPDHAYLTGDKGAVWFAIGRESAWEILKTQMQSNKRPRRSALLDLKLDMTRFLDDSDPAGLGELGRKFDKEFANLVGAGFSASNVELGDVRLPPNHELLAAVLGDGGGKLSLTIDSDKNGVIARAEVGEPLAKYLVARYMSTINRVMAQSEAYSEALQKQQVEAAKALKEAKGGSQ
ncbi:MAG: hypothetical protein AB8G99_24385 [Planctomycetaceae bacterium]